MTNLDAARALAQMAILARDHNIVPAYIRLGSSCFSDQAIGVMGVGEDELRTAFKGERAQLHCDGDDIGYLVYLDPKSRIELQAMIDLPSHDECVLTSVL